MSCFVRCSGSGLDTSDATATAAKILKGYTAYVNDEKITGTALSNSTNATAAQILSGYTAYNSSGSFLSGSYSPTPELYILFNKQVAANTIQDIQSSMYSGASKSGDILIVCATNSNGTLSQEFISGCTGGSSYNTTSFTYTITSSSWSVKYYVNTNQLYIRAFYITA